MNAASVSWPRLMPRLLWRRKCPLCTSTSFQEALPERVDLLFHLLGFAPIRCSNCWRRYYWPSARRL
jgi:hypothetical protein